MDMYYKSVGRNATLIMGLTPDPDGRLPEGDVQRLKEWGDEIKRRFSSPIGSTKGSGSKITLKLKKPSLVNHIIIQEDIQYGERVRAYHVEGKVNGRWQLLTKGESIGHKRIEKFNQVEVSELRLIISKFVNVPKLKNFSA